MRKTTSQNHTGFTLSEVLITIGIIGIIATMTIPSLIQKSVNKQNAVAVIKVYSELSNAIQLYISDNGADLKDSGLFENDQDPSLLWNNFFMKYFNIQKYCLFVSGCFPTGMYKHLNGDDWEGLSSTATGAASGVLNDGTLLRIWIPTGNCSSYCAEVIVDVNGYKGPNQSGRDTFLFQILKDKIIAYPGICDVNSHSNGCAAKVIAEGKISY